MTKLDFVLTLRDRLSEYPRKEVLERLNFYCEMIEDRMEDGIPEEEAVSSVGEMDRIVEQIISDITLENSINKPEKNTRHLKAWEIILLVLGFPVWGSLLIACAAVVFSLYAVLWSVIISLWAVFVSVVACFGAGIVSGVVFLMRTNIPSGLFMISTGFVCAGVSVFLYYGCKAATKGIVLFTRKLMIWLKSCATKRERV